MQLGKIHINKAYLGLTELTPSNAFLGTNPVIDTPQTITFVDLGLPSGTLWASHNIGVDVTDLDQAQKWYGDLFAWGETETKSTFKDDNYKFFRYDLEDTMFKCTKYMSNTYWTFPGYTPDNKEVLDSSDDVATVTFGPGYSLPSESQVRELVEYTTLSTVTDYQDIPGLNGTILTGTNNKHIFFPRDTQSEHFYHWLNTRKASGLKTRDIDAVDFIIGTSLDIDTDNRPEPHRIRAVKNPQA